MRSHAMVLLRAAAILLALCQLTGRAAGRGIEILLYVSPRGSDENPGTRAKPFATLERARDEARGLRSGGDAVVTVRLRGGLYMLPRTFVLRPEDGGTAAGGVTYEAEKGETPVVSGGALIRGWRAVNVNGRIVWKGRVPDGGSEIDGVHELWVNGERCSNSRYPHASYLRVASVPGLTPSTEWLEGQSRFCAAPGDIPPAGILAGAEAVVMNRWVESRLPVIRYVADSALFQFGRKSVFRLDRGDLYYLVNVKSALSRPGDWYADWGEGAIYYIPGKGETPARAQAVVPRIRTLLRIEGSPDSGKFVSHVTFRGIRFEHAGWYFPPADPLRPPLAGGFPQAAIGVPASVEVLGAHDCAFDSCSFSHMGTYGIEFGEGCCRNRVTGCDLSDLGAGGIKIGETTIREDDRAMTSHNTVEGCRIHDGGRLFPSAIGIWIGQSGMNRIVHNAIHDFYYTGISIGWTWGYGKALAGGNLVASNLVHHIGVMSDGDGPILSDMGGIYTLGNQEGTVIRNNIFHDIAALRYGGWGIYFDEGTTHITAEGNLVYRTTHGGFHQHYGKENRFRNNILAFGRDFQVQRTRLENHTSFAFEHNIVLWDGGQFLGGNAWGGNMLFDNNLYWFGGSDSLLFDTLSFAAWQSRGNDVHSRIADPGFVDPARGDFRFRGDSQAARMGFEPITFDRIGTDSAVARSGEAHPAGVRRRVLYNSDGSNIFWRKTFSPADVYASVDEVADAGVTTFLFNPNPCQKGVYPGGKAGMFSYDFPATPGYVRTERDSMYRHFSDNLQMLLKDTLDPVGMIVDRARLRGMEAFLTVRMNELHDVDNPGSPLLGDFWKSHPDYRVGGYEGWGAYALNYGIAEVRDYYFDLVRELCERYPLDGIELDFMRFPYYFPRDSANSPSCALLMTAFIERVRTMTINAGRRRGIPILLSVRVPSSLAASGYVCLDPAAWSRRGLVDFITVAPFLSTEPDMQIAQYKRSCPGIPVYGCLEYTCGERMMTVDEVRGASALFYAAGADGIYSFNYFCAREGGQEPAFSVFHDLGDPDRLREMDKVYTLSAAKYPIPRVSLPAPLPLDLRPGEPQSVTLGVSEPRIPISVRLRVECADVEEEGSLDVILNGVSLGAGRHPSDALVVPQKVLYAPPPVSHVLEFDVDPARLRGTNRVTLTGRKQMTVNWIYCIVKH
ncbi:MAG TPA: right-handed parallel beta-helix repeat-containing protein [Bacteroidota bacterium]|nr:right-handed parallel beta-helix repeat-containing protein [Bacteroidota bacterium]